MTDDPLITAIKSDREKGSKTGWSLSHCESYDGRATYYYQELVDEDLNVIASEVYRSHGDGGSSNMRRLCRVPQMEARILADADEILRLQGKIAARDGEAQAKADIIARLEGEVKRLRAALEEKT